MESNINRRYDRLGRVDDLFDNTIDSLRRKSVAVVGCGGLGGAILTLLCRYPFGKLVIIDRDLVDETNLGHQLLFTPDDARESIPKVVAAERYIKKVNPEIEIVPHFLDLRPANIDSALNGCDIVLDGLDNFDTRFLLNDWCMKNGIPYIYGGLVEREAVTKIVIPRVTGCLRCLIPEPPPPGTTRTCDVYGIHLPVIATLASVMVDTALDNFRAKGPDEGAGHPGELVSIRFEMNGVRVTGFPASRISNPECRTCGGHYDFLEAKLDSSIVHICGQDALSISLGDDTDMKPLLERLANLDDRNFGIKTTGYYVRLTDTTVQTVYTVFTHGRVLMEGSDDESKLRSFVSKYIGI